jgi:hypothetical protein
MSLDVSLMVEQPTEVYSSNITHNLGKMAAEVKLDNGLTLYQILWRPDECNPPYTKANEIAELLYEGLNILTSNPDKYRKFNPGNGWGTYDGLVDFVYNYCNACRETPEAELRISR